MLWVEQFWNVHPPKLDREIFAYCSSAKIGSLENFRLYNNYRSSLIILLYFILHNIGAMTDGRLVVGISKFDRNHTSKRSRSRPITAEMIKTNVVESIKEATSVDISDNCIIPLCGTWALTSSMLASSLIRDSDRELDTRLQEALSDLEKCPQLDCLPRGEGESLRDVVGKKDPKEVIECLDVASGIHSLKEWYVAFNIFNIRFRSPQLSAFLLAYNYYLSVLSNLHDIVHCIS